jgi:hypothetical protein
LPFRYRGSRRESAVAQLFSLGHDSYEAHHIYFALACLGVFRRVASRSSRASSSWSLFFHLAFIVSRVFSLGIFYFPT